jgi:hypothetical protein
VTNGNDHAKCEILHSSAEEINYVVYSQELLWLMANMTIHSKDKVVDFSFSSIHIDPTYNIVKAFVTPISFKLVMLTKGSYDIYFFLDLFFFYIIYKSHRYKYFVI